MINTCIVRLYFLLLDYKHKTDTTHKGMHSLIDTYIKEHGKVNILKNTLYRFEIYFNQKVKEYYCITEEEYINWIKMLKKVTGTFNLFEKYEIVDKLTSGKFGIIRQDGKLIIPLKYDQLEEEGYYWLGIRLILASKNSKKYYVDYCGNEYIK